MNRITTFKGKNKFTMCCDFCAVTSGGAELLIASPNGTHICAECVGVCGDVVAEYRADVEMTASLEKQNGE